MTGNLTPYLVLAATVAATLAWKGYIKLPGLPVGQATPRLADPCGPNQFAPSGLTSSSPKRYRNLIDEVVTEYGSHTLGLAFAKAVRREADEDMLARIAQGAGQDIARKFSDPFSSPVPASGGSAQGASSGG